ncbi:16S rRNA (guanine(527)-N(7))-methyltransferase RsmG [Methylocella silvestris]|uniref:16S rRNA (guanine(527)-N(7))-methyltransferase RsmG n=1 Tax=Methylocella silvestris TaxID=199596 RepID=UPI001FCBAAF6|nr:16S rRNA (guanine(527)-N(7))-methyltransferase RsmG [Methylocella silvestris]
MRRLALYEALLRKWQGSINLVAKSTLDDIWIRHFVDSLQVSAAAPQARRWVDLGSGGGFPGLVTAIRYADDPSAEIHLIESDQRKCAFLRTVSRETGAHAIVHCGRIEDIAAALDAPFDAVSARALAPFSQLLHYAERFLEKGAIGVFSKGEQAEAELTGLSAAARYQIASVASETSDSARLIIVRRRVD